METDELGELAEEGWATLLERISDGKCTPFLGAGVNGGFFPAAKAIANEWAKEFQYPLKNCDDLDKVAQFVAVQRDDPMVPKEKFVRLIHSTLRSIDELKLNEFLTAPDQPLSVVAQLPLPVYITTNYDDLLLRALYAHQKHPKREPCRWNKYVREKQKKSLFDSPSGFSPTPEHPVIFHLHGFDELPESIVLTEDDYLDFLVNISRTSRSKQKILPARIEEALAGASLLFIGYRLADINFRVIFRGLVESLEESQRRISVSVQLPPDDPGQDARRAMKYLAKYFDTLRVRVYWGTAQQFAKELSHRWNEYGGR